MKKIKKLLLGLIATSVAVCTFFNVRTADAATSPYLSVRYNTYTKEDYENKLLYNDGHLETLMKTIVEEDSGYTFSTDRNASITDSINLETLESDEEWLGYWKDETIYASPDGKKSAYDYYGCLPSSIYGSEYTFTYTTNGKGKVSTFTGEEFIVSTTTTFKPGDDIVIEPIVKVTGALLSGASIQIDHTKFASDYSFSTTDDFYTIKSDAPTTMVETNGKPVIGFLFTTNVASSFADEEETAVGAIHMKIDTDATGGNYDIAMNTGVGLASSQFTPGYISGSSYGTYDTVVLTVDSDGNISDRFVETKGSITIQGASTKTGITGITLDGSSTSNPTFDDYALTESVTTPTYVGTGGTNVPSNTYAIGETVKYFTPTFTSPDTGYTGSSVDISASIEDLGSIAGVRYSSGETASIENALKNGTQVTGSSGKFTVPMTDAKPGEVVYAVVDVVASDGSTTDTYIIVLPKAKLTTAELGGISFAGNGTPNSVKLQDTSGVGTTFASGTTDYYIAVANNTTTLTVTPTFDTTVYQTCKVNGTDVTNGSSTTVSGIANETVITVKMTAQDGNTTKEYKFTVKYLSTDTTLQSLILTASGNTYTATYDSTSKIYTIDEVPFAVKNFTLTSKFNNIGQGVVIDGTTMSNNTAISGFSFAAGSTNVNAYTETYTMIVTAEAGNTETYTVNINRKAADTDNTLSNLVIKDNNGNSIGTFNATTQEFTFTNSKLASSVTSVTATATKSSSLATINVNSTGTNTASITFSGSAETTETFTIVVTSEAGVANTITVDVTREKVKSTDATLSGISFLGNGTPTSVKLQNTSGVDTTFASGTLKYRIVVASNTTSINVTPIFTTDRTCTVNGNSATSGSAVALTSGVGNGDTIQVIVTAEDGTTTKTYEFEVNHLSSNTEIQSLTLNASGITGITASYDSLSNKYTINNVPYAVKSFTLTSIFKNNQKSVVIGSTTMTDGTAANFSFTALSTDVDAWTETYSMTVTAEAGNTATYTVNINRVKADDNNKLSNLVIEDNTGASIGSFNATTQTYTLTDTKLSSSVTSITATATAASSLATVTISPSATLTFSGTDEQTKKFTITVTSESGEANTITVSVVREKVKSNNADLSGISFLGNGTPNTVKLQDATGASTSFAPGTTSYLIAVANNTTSLTVKPSFGTDQTCTVNSDSVTRGNSYTVTGIVNGTIVRVTVTAEDGVTTKDYEFKVVYLSTDTTLQSLTLTANGQTYTATYSSNTYTIDNVPFAVKSFTLTSKFMNTSQVVSIGSTIMVNDVASTFTFSASSTDVNAYTQTYTMTVTAEADNTDTYTVNINRKAADTNDKLVDLDIYDNEGNSIGTFDSTTQTFTLTDSKLAYTVASVTADATLPSGSLATIKINSSVTNTLTLTFSGTAEQTKTFTIKVTSEAGAITGTVNTIPVTVVREKADDDVAFTYEAKSDVEQEITNSKDIAMTLSGTTFENDTALDYGTSSVTITLKPNSSTTTIFIDGVDYTNTPYTMNVPKSVDSQFVTKKIYIKTQGNTSGYEFTIKLTTADAEDIHSFTFDLLNSAGSLEAQVPSISGNTYSYVLDPAIYTTGVFKLNINPSSTKATIYTSTDNSNDAALKSNPFDSSDEFTVGDTLYVTVFSQYGNKTTKTIKTSWIDTRDKDNKIKDIDVNVGTLNYVMGTKDYLQSLGTHVSVPFTTTSITFTVTKNSEKSTLVLGVSGVAQSLSVGTNTFKFQLKAENETYGETITIEVVRESGKTDGFVDTLLINGIDGSVVNNTNVHTAFSKYNNLFDFVLPRTSTNAYVAFTVSDGASYRISENNTNTSSTNNNTSFPVPLTAGAYTIVKLEVWSEYDKVMDPSTPTKTYEVYIYAASQDYSLSDIEILTAVGGIDLLDVDGNSFVADTSNANQPVFTVPYKTTTAAIKFTMNDSFAKVSGDGLKNLNVNSNSISVTVMSEYQSLNPRMTAQGETYTVNITRKEASTVDTLDSLSVVINGEEKITGFTSSSTGPYKIENIPDSATTATITYTLTDNLSVVTGDTGTITLDLINNNSQTLHIYVQSEAEAEKTNGAKKDYQIIISREVIVLDDNCEVVNITATDGEGTKYLDKDSSAKTIFNPNVKPYNIKIPAKLGGLTFAVEKAASTSKLFLDDTELTSSTFFVNVLVGQVKEIKIKCQAQDGVAENTYTITIERASYDTDNTLSNLKLNGTPIDGFEKDADKTYVINVPYSQTTAILEGILNKPGYASITANDAPSDAPYNLAVGDNLITITVSAEDPTKTKTYKVNVVRDADNTLSDLEVLDKDGNNLITFDPTQNNYTDITVPYGTDSITINYVAVGGSLVNVTGAGLNNLNEGLNVITIYVETASGVKNPYTISITRESGKTDNYIESYINEDGVEVSINKTDDTYKYIVARNVTEFNPTIIVSDGATYALPTVRVIKQNQANEFKVTVTSETGVENEYTFIVYAAENDFDIDDINVLDKANGSDIIDCSDSTKFVEYDPETKTYNLTVSSTVTASYLEILTSSQYAKVFVNGSIYTNSLLSLNEGDNIYTIYVISEYGYIDSDATINVKSDTYTVNITKEPQNTDATLKELSVTYAGTVYNATQAELDSRIINIENIGDSITSVLINAVANVAYPKTTITGIGNQSLPAFSQSGGVISGYIFTFTVTCTAEDGTAIEYKINLSRGPLDLDADNTINFITIVDSKNKEYLGKVTFVPSKTEYEITIPYGPQSYTITADKLAASPATIFGAGQFNIVFENGQNMFKEHKVYAISEKGDKGTEYTIKITCEAPSNDADLRDLKVDGVTIPGFTPENKGVYVLPTLPNSIKTIDISAYVKDATATVSGSIGTQYLNEGYNVFSIIVTAQSGDKTTYIISVVRDYPLPYLTDLDIVGEELLDNKELPTQFDKDVFEYYAIVTYLDGTATINVSVDNPSHIVACSKATVITNTGTTRTFTVVLAEGINRFTITVTSTEGKTQNYEIIIQRRGLESTNTNIDRVDISQIPQFKDDYTNIENVYPKNESTYTVPNKVRDLDVSVICENTKATYEIFNATSLKTGQNKVIIIITAEDGETRRAVVVNVIRETMSFTVNTDATNFECKQTDKGEYTYTINLGDSNAKAINDYTKYIEFAKEDNLAVEVLTDTTDENCREVVIRVSDGSEEKIVRFELLRNAAPDTVSINYLVWILFAIVIIILIIILICVNKDKYGKISKKRKNA